MTELLLRHKMLMLLETVVEARLVVERVAREYTNGEIDRTDAMGQIGKAIAPLKHNKEYMDRALKMAHEKEGASSAERTMTAYYPLWIIAGEAFAEMWHNKVRHIMEDVPEEARIH